MGWGRIGVARKITYEIMFKQFQNIFRDRPEILGPYSDTKFRSA
jgi:hypothetical protein